jgi:4-amino-4-deoxy-L-arabinose transferase-like glycosyltransferase
MTSSRQTATPSAPPLPAPAPAREQPRAPASSLAERASGRVERSSRLRASRSAAHHLPLVAALALSAVLNVHRLSQNGYANIFYSAGVRSMLGSLHNFLFVSFDPGGLVSVDKPPLGLWVQVASAKLFGFSPLSLLLPEAIAGVLAVAVLYRLLARSFGWPAALAGALALAVFPSFVAVSRDNGVDPVLILLMTLACDAALRAIASGRWRTLLWCGALVGLAFNTKTLAAYLVVPGIVLGYVVCGPRSLQMRVAQLLAAGMVMLVVSFSWIAFVELTPASQRPFVGGSTNNTEMGLTFGYNGFGRVGGEVGGPGNVPVGTGGLALVHARAPSPGAHRGAARAVSASGAHPKHAAPARTHPPSPFLPDGRERNPIPFGGPIGPLRLFGVGLGDQSAWMLPFALIGLVACGLLVLGRGRSRRAPRLAALLVLGGWFLVEAAVLSLSKGIVHPYYVSALAPGAAAMCGAGAIAFTQLARRSLRDWRRLLAPAAVLVTVATEVVLLRREHYLLWFVPVLIGGGALGICALLSARRLAPAAMALSFLLLLAAPTAYAKTTWLAPVEGTFPAAGPKAAAGSGRLGIGAVDERRDRLLLDYVRAHRPGSRWVLLTVASDTAAPFVLLGVDASALAGYSGTDPAVNGPGLARLVSRGEARYVVLGGEYATRGGNAATVAVQRACRQLPPATWQGFPPIYLNSLALFDCAGRERELARA